MPLKNAYLIGDTYECRNALGASGNWSFDDTAKAWKLKFPTSESADTILEIYVYPHTGRRHLEVLLVDDGTQLVAPSPTQKLQQLHDALRAHPLWSQRYKGKLDLAKAPMKERYAAYRDMYGHSFHSRPVIAEQAGASSQIEDSFEVQDAAPPPEAAQKPVETLSPPSATETPDDKANALAKLLADLMSRPQIDRAAVSQIAGELVADRWHVLEDTLPELIQRYATVTHTIEVVAQDGLITYEASTVHKSFPLLLRAVSALKAHQRLVNVWLSGPTGSGKTKAASMLAEALGLSFYMHGSMLMPHELLGYVSPTTGNYHTTAFRTAFEHGGVVLLDEIDAGDNSVLLAINAALANGEASFPDSVTPVKRHPDCIVIGAANTWGLAATADYVGRTKIDAAFLSRFATKIAWEYDDDLEIKISGNVEWAKRVQQARQRAREKGLKIIIDPRHSIAGSDLIAGGFTMDEAADLTYLAGLKDSDRQALA